MFYSIFITHTTYQVVIEVQFFQAPTFTKPDQLDPWIKEQLGKVLGPVSI